MPPFSSPSGVARGHAILEGTIDLLVAETLAPLEADDAKRRAVRALLDARLWLTLLDRGLNKDEARRMLADLSLCALRSPRA